MKGWIIARPYKLTNCIYIYFNLNIYTIKKELVNAIKKRDDIKGARSI